MLDLTSFPPSPASRNSEVIPTPPRRPIRPIRPIGSIRPIGPTPATGTMPPPFQLPPPCDNKENSSPN